MNIRVLTVFVLTTGACRDLQFSSRHPTSSRSRAADGGSSDRGNGGVGAGADIIEGDVFPGTEGPDRGTNNAAEDVAIDDAGAGAFTVPVPWDTDAGVVGDGLPFSFPSPSSLPPANASSQALALAGTPGMEAGSSGCGEPPTCYLRTIIATAQGRVYAAKMSKSYPKDTCVTKTIQSDGLVLVGDSNARFADASCGADTPQITLGFLVPQALFFSWQPGQLWNSTAGFRSEWTLVDAGGDSGMYEPIPGQIAKLWPAWTRFVAGGEIYGELLVPLRHTVKHSPAIGFALFDIRVGP